MIFETRFLQKEDYATFELLYDDFRARAVEDYKFELSPLEYKDFIGAVEKGLIKCIVLVENDFPSAFLIYTTNISEAIELNIIHSYKHENILRHAHYLLEEFINQVKYSGMKKVVCYPMLGIQNMLVDEAAEFGFKFVGTVVLRFKFKQSTSRTIFEMKKFLPLSSQYKIAPWNEEFYGYMVDIIKSSFENSADALFDPRFKSDEGVRDILTKITENIYAEFLPQATSVLLYDDEPIGVCFTNLTDDIANIPLFAIKKDHRHKGLAKYLLQNSINTLLQLSDNNEIPISEVNTTTEVSNEAALKSYLHIGFKEDYNYQQAYLPVA